MNILVLILLSIIGASTILYLIHYFSYMSGYRAAMRSLESDVASAKKQVARANALLSDTNQTAAPRQNAKDQ